MRRIPMLCTLVFLHFSLSAQDTAFKAGNLTISLGGGVPNFEKLLWFNSNGKAAGPFHLKLMAAFSNKVELGFSINVSVVTRTTETLNYKRKSTTIFSSYLIRLNKHFSVTDKIDPYFGVAFGYRENKRIHKQPNSPRYVSFNAFWDSDIPAAIEISVGMRYYIKPNFGLYTELGITKSAMQFGIVKKLKQTTS